MPIIRGYLGVIHGKWCSTQVKMGSVLIMSVAWSGRFLQSPLRFVALSPRDRSRRCVLLHRGWNPNIMAMRYLVWKKGNKLYGQQKGSPRR